MPPKDLNQPEDKKDSIDTSQYLLPTKEIHDPTNAQRVSAGILVEQEQTATLPKAPPPAPIPTRPVNESLVQPLQTYQSDTQKYIQQNKVSEVTMAAAEAKRRGNLGAGGRNVAEDTVQKVKSVSFKVAAIFIGSLLVGAGIGLVGYMLYRLQTVPVAVPPQTPVIYVDNSYPVLVSTEDSHTVFQQHLTQARNSVKLSLGLVAQIAPVSAPAAGGQPTPLDAQAFLTLLAPSMPKELARALLPTFLLGVHSYDVNQPFLILKTDSYEQAFAGMLSWEAGMQGDLMPLFSYTPTARTLQQDTPVVVVATTTAMATTSPAATSTPVGSSTGTSTTTYSTSTVVILTPPPKAQPVFVDKILENHDARVLQNDSGDVYLLWTFLDRGTILITTNPATLKEVISRVHDTPIVPTPGN